LLRRLALPAIICALLLIGWWQRSAIQQTWRRITGPLPAPVLVVFPLEPAGSEASDSAFANGLSQDLIARLGRTRGFTVLGRAGAGRLRGQDIGRIAYDVDAAAALTGTVRRSGQSVAIALELFAVSDRVSTSIWSDEFSGDSADIVALETEAVEAIATVFGIEPGPVSAQANRPIDPSAFDAYLQGQAALAERRHKDAVAFFETAAAADDTLADAHAALVLALRAVNVDEGIPDDPARTARMQAAARRAYELAPDLPQANLAMGLASASLEEALARLHRAIELDPSHAIALEALGDEVRDFDPERGIAFYGRALVADPFLETSRINHATTLLLLNRWGLTRGELLRTTWEHAPAWGLAMYPVLDLAQGSHMDAMADLVLKTPKFRERSYFLALYIAALAGAGKTTEALQEATTLTKQFPESCEGHALLAAVLLDLGKSAEARQTAQPLLEAGGDENARASALRCAASAAAALGDGEQTAAILDRIMSREDLLRSWSFSRFGQSGRLVLMGNIYPWTKVVNLPAVVAARERMNALFEQRRTAIAAQLGPIAYR
jgi:TolB-like protein